MVNVWIVGIDDDNRVSDGVGLVFVDPGVEGRDVNVLNLFSKSSLCHVMQFDGIGAAAKEGIPGLKRVHDFEGVEELA